MERYHDLLNKWMDADQVAHAAAKALMHQRSAHFFHNGPVPTRSQEERVERLRAEAQRLYELALKAFDEGDAPAA
jgi:hypothetical protein